MKICIGMFLKKRNKTKKTERTHQNQFCVDLSVFLALEKVNGDGELAKTVESWPPLSPPRTARSRSHHTEAPQWSFCCWWISQQQVNQNKTKQNTNLVRRSVRAARRRPITSSANPAGTQTPRAAQLVKQQLLGGFTHQHRAWLKANKQQQQKIQQHTKPTVCSQIFFCFVVVTSYHWLRLMSKTCLWSPVGEHHPKFSYLPLFLFACTMEARSGHTMISLFFPSVFFALVFSRSGVIRLIMQIPPMWDEKILWWPIISISLLIGAFGL